MKKYTVSEALELVNVVSTGYCISRKSDRDTLKAVFEDNGYTVHEGCRHGVTYLMISGGSSEYESTTKT